jgi:polysaccharide chain length determinant protein (PEP-CTERM system associated)
MLPGKKITPLDVLKMARRRAWLVILPPCVTLFAALVYSSTIPNMYQSNMLIAIVPQSVPDEIVRSTVTLRTEARLDAISVEVMSRANLAAMIEEHNLYPELRRTRPMEDVVGTMRANLVVGLEPMRRGVRGLEAPHAFHIRFTYGDPAVAAQITQLIGSRFVEQNAQDRGALAAATNQFLDQQLAEARRRLEEQERKLEIFRERHGKALPTQLPTNLQAIQSKQLQVQSLVESIARDRDRKLVLERLYREALAEPAPAPVVVPPPPVRPDASPTGTVAQQLAAARAELAGLESRYTANHPDVSRARRKVTELEAKAAGESPAAPAAPAAVAGATPTPAAAAPMDPARRERLREMAAEIESLDRQTEFKEREEVRVRAEIADYQSRVEAVPGLESEWVALTRDYDTNQAAYRDLLAKAEAARVAVNLEERQIGEQFRIVDPAGVPVHPVTSERLKINGIGLALGLFLGLGLAAFLEFRDTSYHTDADVLEVLALPVLASVPRIATAEDARRQSRRRMAMSVAGVVGVTVAGYITWLLKLWTSLI